MISGAGGLNNPYLQLFNTSLDLTAADDNSGGSKNARIIYTSTATGTYYLAAWDSASGTGAYSLSATVVADDYSGSANTTNGIVAVNGNATAGIINFPGDNDYFKVSLQAGTNYVFDLVKTTTAGLSDPYLSLLSPTLTQIASDDNSGGSNNSRISYTALTSGIYYLGVADYGTGTGGYTLSTAAAAWTQVGTSANDTIQGTTGNDRIDGGSGIDTVVLAGNRTIFALSHNADNSFTIRDESGTAGTDTLINVERLQFSDSKIALDLDGNAGTTAKILGAVFGAASVSNKQYVGIGLSCLDAGWTYENLMAVALDAAGAKTHAAVVNLLWANLVGSAPTAEQAAPYVAVLDNGTYSPGFLGVICAELDLNKTHINLVGLAQTGIEYS